MKVDESEQSFITSTQDNPNRAANFNTSVLITPQVNKKNVNLIETEKKDIKCKSTISSKTLKKLHAFSFSSEDDEITENDKKSENIEDKKDEESNNQKENIIIDDGKEDHKVVFKNPPNKEKLSAMMKSIGAPEQKKQIVAFSDPFGDDSDLEDDFFTEIQQQTAKTDTTQKSQISSSAMNIKANNNFAKPLRPILKSSNGQSSSTQTNKQIPSLSRDKLLSMMNMIEKSRKIDNESKSDKPETKESLKAVEESEKAEAKAPNVDKIRSMFRSINQGPTDKPTKENIIEKVKESKIKEREVSNKEGPRPNKAAPSREKLLAMMKSIQSKQPPVSSQNQSVAKKSVTKMTSFDSDDDYDDLDINEFFKKK